MVLWLRRHTSTVAGTGSNPGWVTKILHATWGERKKESSLYLSLATLPCAETHHPPPPAPLPSIISYAEAETEKIIYLCGHHGVLVPDVN